MIRLCYSEHPDYVPLLRRTYELWAQLQAQTGRDLLHLTGGLYLGRADGELVGGALRAAEVHGLPHELLSHDQVAERFGQFRLPADHVGFYEPDAGFLLPRPVIRPQPAVALPPGACPQGWSGVTVTAGDDSVPEGNAAAFVISPSNSLSALVLESSGARPNQSLYLTRALEIGDRPSFRVPVRRLSQFRLSDLDGQSILVLNDAPFPGGQAGQRSREFVEAGGG